MSEKKRDYSGHRPPDEVRVIVGEQAGHQPPRIEAKDLRPDAEKSGHRAPSGEGPVLGSGHPPPARIDPMNLSPPPKRDDAGSSGKPPAK
jgi:hypothetical protein